MESKRPNGSPPSPHSQEYFFLSQESSADVVEEALRLGGRGYVHKTEAQQDLVAAVETVLQGKRFISGRLAAHFHTDAADSSPSPSIRSAEH